MTLCKFNPPLGSLEQGVGTGCTQTLSNGNLVLSSFDFGGYSANQAHFYYTTGDFTSFSWCFGQDLCNDLPDITLHAIEGGTLPGVLQALTPTIESWLQDGDRVMLWSEGGDLFLALDASAAVDAATLSAFESNMQSADITISSAEIATINSDVYFFGDLPRLTFALAPPAQHVAYGVGGVLKSGSAPAADAVECRARCDDQELCAAWTYWPHSSWCNVYASAGGSHVAAHATVSDVSASNVCQGVINRRFDFSDVGNAFLAKSTEATEHDCCDVCVANASCSAFHYKLSKQKCVLLSAATGATVATQSWGVLGRVR